MKRVYIFVIAFCLSFALFGFILPEKKTVNQIIEHVDFENLYTEVFNNGRKDFLYTFVETKKEKLTIISDMNGNNASIVTIENYKEF